MAVARHDPSFCRGGRHHDFDGALVDRHSPNTREPRADLWAGGRCGTRGVTAERAESPQKKGAQPQLNPDQRDAGPNAAEAVWFFFICVHLCESVVKVFCFHD